MTIQKTVINNILLGKGKKFCVLIDPDKHDNNSLRFLIDKCNKAGVDFLMVGGSLLLSPIEDTLKNIKKQTNLPLVLFPGNLTQLSGDVDAMLLLSVISGRNPELLIGNHVIAAPLIRRLQLKTFATGYMLIGTGKMTSVEYMSNTTPIPEEKTDIAVATALAGEMLGLNLIYLEGGSGAKQPVPLKMIKAVKEKISIPLIVGGGIKTKEQLFNVCKAGADIIVVGNLLESNSELISEFSSIVHGFN